MTTSIVLPYDESPKDYRAFLTSIRPYADLMPQIGMLKIGLEAMNANFVVDTVETSAAIMLRRLVEPSKVLWDQKIADIGNTTAATLRNLVDRVGGVTLHASMSSGALREAGKLLEVHSNPVGSGSPRLTLFGVTVLTDMSEGDCVSTFGDVPTRKVLDFARRLVDSGLNGIVCSGQELAYLRDKGVTGLRTLVPGIRPAWSETGDQKRIVTPAEATRNGADYIVVGRPIMQAENPREAAERILEEIENAH